MRIATLLTILGAIAAVVSAVPKKKNESPEDCRKRCDKVYFGCLAPYKKDFQKEMDHRGECFNKTCDKTPDCELCWLTPPDKDKNGKDILPNSSGHSICAIGRSS